MKIILLSLWLTSVFAIMAFFNGVKKRDAKLSQEEKGRRQRLAGVLQKDAMCDMRVNE